MKCNTCNAPVRGGVVTMAGWYAFGFAAWRHGRLAVTPYCGGCVDGARMAERMERGNPSHEGLSARAYAGGVWVTYWEGGRSVKWATVSVSAAMRVLDAVGPASSPVVWAALMDDEVTRAVTALNGELRRFATNSELRNVWAGAGAALYSTAETPWIHSMNGERVHAFGVERVLQALRALQNGTNLWTVMQTVQAAMRQ